MAEKKRSSPRIKRNQESFYPNPIPDTRRRNPFVDENRDKTVLETVYERAERAGRPLSVHFELTDRCNLTCRHCYVVRGAAPEMTTVQVNAALDALAQAGVIFVTFTGGEPFVRADLFEILEYSRSLNFSVRLFTNGTLIDEAAADRLAGLSPREIGISLYGASAETHDYMTRVQGSFVKSLAAARMLIGRGVRVVVKSVLMKPNFEEYGALIDLALGMGAAYMFDATVFPRDDGGREPLELRLDDGQLEAVLSDPRLLPGAGAARPTAMPDVCRGPVCDLGVVCLGVSASGDVFPCLQFRRNYGSLKNIENICLNEVIQGIRSCKLLFRMKIENLLFKCYNCNLKEHCMRCPGLAALEDGDVMGPSEWACRLARARAKASAHDV
jgi:radical SAM protein with 4Fe4S-binding SPASM domain